MGLLTLKNCCVLCSLGLLKLKFDSKSRLLRQKVHILVYYEHDDFRTIVSKCSLHIFIIVDIFMLSNKKIK